MFPPSASKGRLKAATGYITVCASDLLSLSERLTFSVFSFLSYYLTAISLCCGSVGLGFIAAAIFSAPASPDCCTQPLESSNTTKIGVLKRPCKYFGTYFQRIYMLYNHVFKQKMNTMSENVLSL